MTVPFLIKFEDEVMRALRGRSAEGGEPVSQVVQTAVRKYLGMGEAVEVPERRKGRVKMQESGCRDCGHRESVHTNGSVSSGSGCVFMGCACRRFRGE